MNIRPIVLLLALVSAVVIGCSAAPTPAPAPSGPSMTEEEAIATVKQHLQGKRQYNEGPMTCWMALERLGLSDMSADYDPTAHRWDIGSGDFGWSVYERTGSCEQPSIGQLMKT